MPIDRCRSFFSPAACRSSCPSSHWGASSDLQHHPHAQDDEAAHVEGGLPLERPVRPERGEVVQPGVAGCDPEQRHEGAVELAKVIGREVGEEGHSQDRVCQRGPRPVKAGGGGEIVKNRNSDAS